MHRTTPFHRTTRTGDLHRSLYAALRCRRCCPGPDRPTRRTAAGITFVIKRARLAQALRHPAIWWGDRSLRRGTL